jgi:hypothetical protein
LSDIGLDLSGIVALLIFLATAATLGVCGLICGIVAFVRGHGTAGGVKTQPAFGYFALAAAMGLVNLIAFGVLLVLVDHIDKDLGARFDMLALYVWLPAQPVLWLASAVVFNKLRKK